MLVPRLLVGLTVYRIGGDSLPPPAEVGDGDAAFVFVEWEDIGKEGAAHQLDIGVGIWILESASSPASMTPI